MASLSDKPRLSVVIPALNEGTRIVEAVNSARAACVEVIVADGGSRDETASLAAACGATVVVGSRGRAAQMNRGASLARGEFILFLHADSSLPAGYAAHVSRILADPENIGGAFRLSIEPTTPANRLLAATTNLRSRLFKLPYGDQAIFMRRSTFERLGGYASIPLMEDVEIVRRLKRLGRLRIAPRKVSTSGRRWEQFGTFKMSLMNQQLLLRYLLGADPVGLHRERETMRLVRPQASPAADRADSPFTEERHGT